MRKHIYVTALVGLALTAAGSIACAQTPTDVPKEHWAYAAVEDLASKGLIKGYPAEGKFFGGRTVTRYEMATLVQRVLARIDELLAKKADKGTEAPASPKGISAQQFTEVRKLVEDFKMELTIIGTDMSKVKDEIKSLGERLNVVQDVANTAKSTADKAATDAATAKSAADDANAKIPAVIDAVKEQAARVDKLSHNKVESGFGSFKLGGLFQVWTLNELDAPNRGQVDTFRLRRAEIKLSGNINPQAYMSVMIDASKNPSLNTTSAGGNITSVSPNQTSNVLQDFFLGFNLAPKNMLPHWTLELGQQKVPMSMEGVRSSGKLYTVERSIFNTSSVGNNAGRVGDIRDTGAMLRFADNGVFNNNGFTSKSPAPRAEAQLGVFNDAGNRQNTTDDNNQKEFIGHFIVRPRPNIMLGAYGEASQGVNGALKTPRIRQGVEGSITLGRHLIETEVVRARDSVVAGGAVTNNRLLSTGGYLFYGYTVSPKWQIVARGEYWNANRDGHGTTYGDEKDLTLGFQYFLEGEHSKIQFNYIRKNINGVMPGSFGVSRNLFLLGFQAAVQ